MPETALTVHGMSCGGCEDAVESALGDLDGVTTVEADHEHDRVIVTADGPSEDEIRAAIEGAGYDVAGTAS